MTIPLTINGVTWDYPQTGNTRWGVQATGWASSVTTGMLQKAGGAFTLTAEVDFGAGFGLKSIYYKSRAAIPSLTGQVRLGNTESVSWRNFGDSADLALDVNASDQLEFNGEVIPAGPIVDADIAANAAIQFSKMQALTASGSVVTDASGFIVAGASSAAQVNFLSTVTSDVQVQIDGKVAKSGDTMTGFLVLNSDPVSSLQAATKQYVDSLATGINAKTACRVATTSPGTLASSFENGDTVDGVTLATNDRILIKNQVAQTENGIYTVNASGAPTRATDADTWAELVGAFVFITAGTANAATQWVCNVAPGGTIGVTPITFVQFGAQISYTADNQGVQLVGNQFSLQLDGGTLSQSGSGVKVADGGIINTQIAVGANIALAKLAALDASAAVVTDGSGIIIDSVTTATQIGYLSTLTGNVQTALDSKIPASVMTSDGDLITRASGVPARIAIGTNGYVLQSTGSAAAWTSKQASFSVVKVNGTAILPTTFTAMTFASLDGSSVNPVTLLGSNQFQFLYSSTHVITINLSEMQGTAGRLFMFRLRNITDSSTTAKSVTCGIPSSTGSSNVVVSFPCSPDPTKTYELQFAASGSGVQFKGDTVNGETSPGYIITIERVYQ